MYDYETLSHTPTEQCGLRVQNLVFWPVTPYVVAVGYQRFVRPYCLHLQGEESV